MKITVASEFHFLSCSVCGIPYGVPANWHTDLKQNHKIFYCPNGHEQYIPKDSEEKGLDRELEAGKKFSDRLSSALEKSLLRERSLKGQITKLRNKLDTR